MKVVKGDLIDLFFKGDFDIIIHGCNCQKMMGAGIARQIAERIPEAKLADNLYDIFPNSIDKLSNYSFAIVRREGIHMGVVINLYTQYMPGRDLDYNALMLGFRKIAKKLKVGFKIGIPEIGCGIAGGNWKTIGPKISEIMKEHNLTVVEYVPNTNAKN